MNELPSKSDLEFCGGAIESYCRFITGKHKDYDSATKIRESWKKINRFVENILKEAFLKNE